MPVTSRNVVAISGAIKPCLWIGGSAADALAHARAMGFTVKVWRGAGWIRAARYIRIEGAENMVEAWLEMHPDFKAPADREFTFEPPAQTGEVKCSTTD